MGSTGIGGQPTGSRQTPDNYESRNPDPDKTPPADEKQGESKPTDLPSAPGRPGN